MSLKPRAAFIRRIRELALPGPCRSPTCRRGIASIQCSQPISKELRFEVPALRRRVAIAVHRSRHGAAFERISYTAAAAGARKTLSAARIGLRGLLAGADR